MKTRYHVFLRTMNRGQLFDQQITPLPITHTAALDLAQRLSARPTVTQSCFLVVPENQFPDLANDDGKTVFAALPLSE